MDGSEVHIHLEKKQPLKVGNKVFKSAFDWELSKQDLEKAANELGETEEKKETCLRKLKEKLSNESNIKFRQDDFYWLRFLRVRKYDVEKTYQNVKISMELRRKNAHLIAVPPDMKPVLELNIMNILPYLDEERRLLFLVHWGRWKPEEKTYEEIAPAFVSVSEISSMNPTCQINGVVAIWDLAGLSLRHITEVLRNGRPQTLSNVIQNGYPWRIKAWYMLNINRLVRFFYSLMKPLMSRKLVERCVLLGSDVNELHQYVNPALLPKRLNGTLEEEECDTSQVVLSNLEYLRFERSFD